MPASLNKVQIIGYLGQDPESRNLGNGDAVVNISVATTDQWTDKGTGEKRESTEWHRVAIFRRQAEIAAQYLRKGSCVYIEGKLKTNRYVDGQGVERFSTEIVCDEFQMLGEPRTGTAPNQARQQAPAAAPQQRQAHAPQQRPQAAQGQVQRYLQNRPSQQPQQAQPRAAYGRPAGNRSVDDSPY